MFIVCSTLGLLLALVMLVWQFQEKLLFFPEELPEDYSFNFKERFQEFSLHATYPEGSIHLLRFYSPRPTAVILYFHGNAGSLRSWGHMGAALSFLPADLIIFDYRSYGKSRGQLSEKAIYADALLLYEQLKSWYPTLPIVLFGRSIGTGPAAYLARERMHEKRIKGLVLESPFTSLVELAKKHYPMVPSILLRYRFPVESYLKEATIPVLILHGEEDEICPLPMAEQLHAAIPNSTIWRFPGRGHNDLSFAREYNGYLMEYWADILGAKSSQGRQAER